jgi:hypothetical protein
MKNEKIQTGRLTGKKNEKKKEKKQTNVPPSFDPHCFALPFREEIDECVTASLVGQVRVLVVKLR